MLKKKIILIINLFISGYYIELCAQNQKDNNLVNFSLQINASDLKQHLMVLASDEYEGRETGRKGQKLAANYLKEQFEKNGLKAGNNGEWFQTYYLIEEKPLSVISLNGNTYNFLEDYYFFPGTKDSFFTFNEIIFAGYGIESDRYNDYKNLEINNKAVLILSGEPTDKKGKSLVTGTKAKSIWSTNIWKKIQTAQKLGAKLILIQTSDFEKNKNELEHYITKPVTMLKNESKSTERNKRKREDVNELQYVFISEKIMNVLIEKNSLSDIENRIMREKKTISKTIKASLELTIQKDKKEFEAENVLAYIEGTDKKDELVIITAHYDHLGVQEGKIYYGADDDGTGTVALIELAQAFQHAVNMGFRPRRSLLIMPVSGEEKGLFGSYYYSKNPVYDLKKTVANLNIDMIGRTDTLHNNANYVYIIGSDMLSKQLDEICKKANATYTQIELDYRYNKEDDPNRFYYRSDHYNFARNNIPVIFFFSGVHADYHKPSDTVDKIDFEKVEKITRLVFFTAWDLLNREQRIKLNSEIE